MSTERIKELEKALEAAKEKEGAALDVARDLYNKNQSLIARNKWLEARIQELESPKGRRAEDRSWIDKIVLVIGRTERPMRSRELMHELKAMDKDYAIESLSNPEGSLSVALARAVETGRLKQFKVPGTRGAYYALPKWVDKNGNLSKAMRDEMW